MTFTLTNTVVQWLQMVYDVMGHLDCIAQSLRLILFVLYSADELSDLLYANVFT
jgi:hypothetical protein